MQGIVEFFRLLMLPIIFTSALVITVVACAEVDNSTEIYFQFTDPEVQEKFIEELKSNNVRYRLSEDGLVWFYLKDKGKVDEIKNKIIEKEFKVNAITFPEEKYVWLFKSKLDGLNINYVTHMRSGREYISWDKKSDNIVGGIIKEIGNIIDEDNIKKFRQKQQQ